MRMQLLTKPGPWGGAMPSPTDFPAAENQGCAQWRYQFPVSCPLMVQWSIVVWAGPNHTPAHTNAGANRADPPPPWCVSRVYVPM